MSFHEDLQHFRLHASGQPDVSLLQSLASELGPGPQGHSGPQSERSAAQLSLRMVPSPPRLDWSDPSTLFFETGPPPAGAGRVGYVFPLTESNDILQRFEAVAERVAAETPTLDGIRSL